jgi:hypothetical protein
LEVFGGSRTMTLMKGCTQNGHSGHAYVRACLVLENRGVVLATTIERRTV